MHQPRLYADYTTLGLGSLRSHLSNAPVQRRRVSAVRCNRLLAGQAYFNRFIGGAIHLHTSASTFGQ